MDLDARASQTLAEADGWLRGEGLAATNDRRDLRRRCQALLDEADLLGRSDVADAAIARLGPLGGMEDWVRVRWSRRLLRTGWEQEDLPNLAWLAALQHDPRLNLVLDPVERDRLSIALEEIARGEGPFARAASCILLPL